MSHSRALQFISCVQEHPSLWDTDVQLYHNMSFKDGEWQKIVDDLCWPEIPDITTAKREWKKLRDNHRDALKRNKQNINSKWRYTDAMEFVVPFMKTRKRKRFPVSPDKYLPTLQTSSPTNYFDNSDSDPKTPNNETVYIQNNIKTEPIDENYENNEKMVYGMDGNENMELVATPVVSTKECHKCCCHLLAGQEKEPINVFFQYLCSATKQLPASLQISVKKKMFAILTEAEDKMKVRTE